MKHLRFLSLVFLVLLSALNKVKAETWNCGKQDANGNYGENVKCVYDETSKTLTISGSGEMADYDYLDGGVSSTAPWVSKNIIHAVIEGNVTSIGARTFKDAYRLQDITGTENITRVGDAAFFAARSLKSIDLPNVQEIGGIAFGETAKLEYVGIPDGIIYGPDTIAASNRDTFVASKLSNCRKTGDCGSCGDKVVQSGVGCVNDCFDGYTSYYGFCTRTRYTLPEADAATSNDNENMIEWIFE